MQNSEVEQTARIIDRMQSRMVELQREAETASILAACYAHAIALLREKSRLSMIKRAGMGSYIVLVGLVGELCRLENTTYLFGAA